MLPIACDVPFLAHRLSNGSLRLYLFNAVRDRYGRAFVDMGCEVEDVCVISEFPLLPVRYKDSTSSGIRHSYGSAPESKRKFEVKLAPGGIAVLEIRLKKQKEAL